MKAFGLVPVPSENGDCRYAANDELRFSLRSVELYVPWVRRVFIVIADDATPPGWLRLGHPKLRIVRLGEIMPDPAKPCFCSDSIEHRLAFIPGLSERFLYSNDDCMFYRPLSPSFFFARDGYPIFRFGGVMDAVGRGVGQTYRQNLANAAKLVRAAYPKVGRVLDEALARGPHHCIDAYRKRIIPSNSSTHLPQTRPDYGKVGSP